MADARIQRIARKLREEAETFVDYRRIEEETETLGFPTSVRTLRFYVSEGILPPPRRQGKTPVYPREWILNVLLAIHVMKTRLGRGLVEIKAVIENLREDPELLADKCAQLYELGSRPGGADGDGGGGFGPAQARRVADRFFESLEDGRQPSDVRITDLVKECETRGGAGDARENGRDAPRRDTLPSKDDGRSFPSAERLGTGGDGPEEERGALRPRGRARARELENIFIRSFESAYRSLEEIYHPVERRLYPTRSSGRDPVIADEYLRVAETLKEARLFDRELFDSLPLDKSTRFDVTSGRLVARRIKIAVVGASWSPLRDLVEHGSSARRAGGTDLCRLLDRVVDAGDVFFYVGVHSTTGWEPEVARHLPRGDNYRVALIEFDDEAGWMVRHDFSPEAAAVASLYDPESPEEKVERCARRISELPELQVRGGFVLVEDLPKKFNVGVELLEEALRRVAARAEGIGLVTARGKRLVKRERLG